METKKNYQKSLWEYYRNLSEEELNYGKILNKNMSDSNRKRKKEYMNFKILLL